MIATYCSLFIVSFGAATILPMQSEAVLAGLLVSKNYTPWVLVMIASIGNTLGSTMNWALGWQAERFSGRKWFPIKPAALESAKNWYHRYGYWSLLLSWLPFIGDPLTLAAGVLREKFGTFLAIVAVAKTSRYLAILFLVS